MKGGEKMRIYCRKLRRSKYAEFVNLDHVVSITADSDEKLITFGLLNGRQIEWRFIQDNCAYEVESLDSFIKDNL